MLMVNPVFLGRDELISPAFQHPTSGNILIFLKSRVADKHPRSFSWKNNDESPVSHTPHILQPPSDHSMTHWSVHQREGKKKGKGKGGGRITSVSLQSLFYRRTQHHLRSTVKMKAYIVFWQELEWFEGQPERCFCMMNPPPRLLMSRR